MTIAPDRQSIVIGGKEYPLVGNPALMTRGIFRTASALADKFNQCKEDEAAQFHMEHVALSLKFTDNILRFALGDEVMDELEPVLDGMSHLDYCNLGFAVLEKYTTSGDEVAKVLAKVPKEEQTAKEQ